MFRFCINIFLVASLFSISSFNKEDRVKWRSKDNYSSIYLESLNYLDNNNLEMYILSLNNIISSSKNNLLIMNSYYDLGQIYLSRYKDYYLAVDNFNYILNNSFSNTLKPLNLDIKDSLELKEKSLFMIAYIYFNHIGNLTLSLKFYTLFLDRYPNNELSSSVKYEIDLINKELKNFNKGIKNGINKWL